MRHIKDLIVKMTAVGLAAMMVLGLAGCSGSKTSDSTELTILAAASLTDVCEELKGQYEQEHPGVTLTFSYGCNAALYSRQKKHFIFDSINTITALSFR